MKLLFKQRFFSWFDSYDIFDENGNRIKKAVKYRTILNNDNTKIHSFTKYLLCAWGCVITTSNLFLVQEML